MKRIAFLVVLCIAAFSFRATELSIGDELPKSDVQVQDISGKNLTLKDVSKKNGLLVMFSCNTCPYVIKNQERTNAILKYAQSKNIGVVVLNSNEAYRAGEDSYDAMKSYAAGQGYKWTYAVDKNHELADAFGATRTPECYLFNSQQKLVYHGAIDDSPADASAVSKIYLKEAINEMTEGKEVTVKTSRSIGCSIKRLKS